MLESLKGSLTVWHLLRIRDWETWGWKVWKFWGRRQKHCRASEENSNTGTQGEQTRWILREMSQRKGPHWRAPEQTALKKSVVKIKTLLSSERNSNIYLGTRLLSYIHSVFFKVLLWQFYKLILTHSIFTPKFPPSSFTHVQKDLKLDLLGSS